VRNQRNNFLFVRNDDRDKREEVLIKDRTDSKDVLRYKNTTGVRIREMYI